MSFSADYFAPADILATAERVPCQVHSDLAHLGFLDPSSSTPHLAAGSKLEVPLWMSSALQRGGHVQTELPKEYNGKSREIMKAEPSVMNLNKWGPHFYETGRHLVRLKTGGAVEGEDLGQVLSETLTKRFRHIMDSSQNASECDALTQKAKLDELERRLFESGQAGKRRVDAWFGRSTGQISASAMVQRHKKRKAAAME